MMKSLFNTLVTILLAAMLIGSDHADTDAAEPATTITFATVPTEETLAFQQAEAVYHEAFRRLGYDFTMESRPAERALLDANTGKIDGEGGRAFDLNKHNDYLNLIRVEEPILDVTHAAFATNPDIRIESWDDLQGQDWLIGHYRGVKLTEKTLPLYVDEEHLIVTTDAEESCRMLAAGRLDLFIDSVESVATLIEIREEFSAIRNVGTVQDLSVYPYLHTKHQELAPQLAATLQAMKADGTYQQLMEQVAQEMETEQ